LFLPLLDGRLVQFFHSHQLKYSYFILKLYCVECTAVGSSIYCYGGIFTTPTQNIPQSDTWSIDVSADFTVSSASWTNVTHYGDFATTASGFEVIVPLKDGVSFLVNGGISAPLNQSEVNQTTVFNTATKTWSSVNSTGITQARQHTAAIDTNGRIWLWGGLRYMIALKLSAALSHKPPFC
jgi:hypothetical protein